ncbi:MAG: glycosyltransferase family 2 protein [Parvularculaceae bacterium]
MTAVIDMVALFLAFILFALSAFLLAEVVAAFIARPERPPPQVQKRARIGVVIPAHNERDAVAATVKAVRAELRDVDRLIVVADNCSDDTAALAGPAGADAIERNDASRCGKGYALQFGVDHLRGDPPDVVVFIDADCRPAPGAIEKIAARAAYIQRPVQALYLMNVPDGAKPKASVSAFAWLVMNRVRMSGLQKIAGVTRLTGSGMALPWRLVSDIDIASGEIVEDIALTAKFVEAGYPPFLDLDALVTSRLAASDKGAATQRARWELARSTWRRGKRRACSFADLAATLNRSRSRSTLRFRRSLFSPAISSRRSRFQVSPRCLARMRRSHSRSGRRFYTLSPLRSPGRNSAGMSCRPRV